ncbi:MAG: sporulation initiation factor Spo0A C-terminal domain-containing protein [Muribaculaceae bacterium]|nr:sporulation initiation factor Spo0A C-terminal domain-containing protein [Alistipes senegalensis]MCM1472642.1 sporulation initiation factor Spo0A C-terminal domain-containing protein [Muribaculaceae bacterium]
MKNIKLLINGNSAKCAEIATELSAFGMNTVIRPDFSGGIASEVNAVIFDKSAEATPTVDVVRGVKNFVLTSGQNPLISEEKGVLYISATLPTESIVNLVRHNVGSMELQKIVTQFLLDLGVPTHMKGYLYAVEAIALVIENPRYKGAFHKKLYPIIAEKYDSNTWQVERNIRTAIQGTYERHEIGYFKQFFGYAMQKPTVTEFISQCAEKIRTEML